MFAAALTFSQGNDDPADVVSVHEVHGVDATHFLGHVPGHERDARLALYYLAVDRMPRAVLHTVRLECTLVDETLTRGSHHTYEHLGKISIIVNID